MNEWNDHIGVVNDDTVIVTDILDDGDGDGDEWFENSDDFTLLFVIPDVDSGDDEFQWGIEKEKIHWFKIIVSYVEWRKFICFNLKWFKKKNEEMISKIKRWEI